MDDDICIVLTPIDDIAKAMFRLSANHHLRKPVLDEANGRSGTNGVGSRDTTPALDLGAYKKHVELVLGLSFPPRNPEMGWCFGRSSQCDVVLSDSDEVTSMTISSKHFYIRMNKEGWFFLVDVSTHGTAVCYDGVHEKDFRSNESWLISRGPLTQPLTSNIIVDMKNGMRFSIETSCSDANRAALYKLCQSALPPLDMMGLESGHDTAQPSRPETPRTQSRRPALYLRVSSIGEGSYGDVDKVIRLRDGTILARKTLRPIPKQKHKRKRGESVTQLEREVRLMREAKHVSIGRPSHMMVLGKADQRTEKG